MLRYIYKNKNTNKNIIVQEKDDILAAFDIIESSTKEASNESNADVIIESIEEIEEMMGGMKF